jgi:hypothetical protein
MSAEAVCAVRLGLRMEFSRPSQPGVPSSAASGRPSRPDSGRAIAGASIATPTKMHTAPAPTIATTGLDSPRPSSGTPSTASAVPEMRRRLVGPVPDRSVPRSVSAATGGIRTAFRAGPIAETTVTSVPTASPTIAVRGSNVSDPDGSEPPKPPSSA